MCGGRSLGDEEFRKELLAQRNGPMTEHHYGASNGQLKKLQCQIAAMEEIS